MRFTGFALALALVPAAPPAGAQALVGVPTDPQVVTHGEGSVQTAPDRAWITISAESRAASPREAQRINSEAMGPAQSALKAARIPDDAIRTVGYDLQQEFDFVNNRRVSKGYLARNSIEVRVDEVSRVGELLEIAVRQGATSVSNLRFDVKDRAKLEREALRLAVQNARLKAEAAAAGAGRAIDRLVRIDEMPTSNYPQPMAFGRAVVQGGADAAPPITAGQIEVQVQVTATFALK